MKNKNKTLFRNPDLYFFVFFCCQMPGMFLSNASSKKQKTTTKKTTPRDKTTFSAFQSDMHFQTRGNDMSDGIVCFLRSFLSCYVFKMSCFMFFDASSVFLCFLFFAFIRQDLLRVFGSVYMDL